MILNAQWRTNDGHDTLLVIDLTNDPEIGEVVVVLPVDTEHLAAFLTNMGDLGNWTGEPIRSSDPENYGYLVMERSGDGGVVMVDDRLFPDRLEFWFPCRVGRG